jgi:hypothetical protein
VFREIYDLTGLAKFKACIDIVDNLLQKCQKIVICALHASFLTQLEDYLTNKALEFTFMTPQMGIE